MSTQVSIGQLNPIGALDNSALFEIEQGGTSFRTSLTQIKAGFSIGELSNVTLTAPADGHVLIYQNASSSFENMTISGDATLTAAGALAIANDVIDNDNLATGVFGKITGLGTQTQDLVMGGFDARGISNLEFQETTGAPLASVRAFYYTSTGFHINALTGTIGAIKVNGVNEYTFSSTIADFLGNTIDNVLVLQSNAANLASAGFIRMGNTEGIFARNAGNTNDHSIVFNASDQVEVSLNGAVEYTLDAAFMAYNGAAIEDVSAIRDGSQNNQVSFDSVASAVNHLIITNAATGNGPTLGAEGVDANIDLILAPKGTGKAQITADILKLESTATFTIQDTNDNSILALTPNASAVNFITIFNHQTTGPGILPAGPGANIDLLLQSKGTGLIKCEDITEVPELRSSAANIGTGGFLNMPNNVSLVWRNSTNTNNNSILFNGSDNFQILLDATVRYQFSATRADFGGLILENISQINDANSNEVLAVTGVASAVNHVSITNATTGNGPKVAAAGDDTNVDLELEAKGTGVITAVSNIQLAENLLLLALSGISLQETANQAVMQVADDTINAGFVVQNNDGHIKLLNAIATVSEFAPAIEAKALGSSNSVVLEGEITAADDTGSTPVTVFRSQRDTPAALVTRPAFQWQNFSTVLLTLANNGDLTVVGDIVMGDRFQGQKGPDVTSTDAITLGDGNYFLVTGTTTINHCLITGWQAGSVVVLEFAASLTVTDAAGGATGDEADFELNGGNFVTAAGDILIIAYNGTVWKEIGRVDFT